MRSLGPCKILSKYGNNTFKVVMPKNQCLSPTFNIEDLISYKGHAQDVDKSLEEVTQDVVF